MGICEMYEEGLDFQAISEKIMKKRDDENVYFVLDTLDFLRKNGRLTGLQAFFATALNIKPIMGAEKGVIIKLEQARGINKAFARMCEIAVKEAGETEKKRVIIAHCNCPERAAQVKQEMEKRASFREILITETAGVATMYAGDGGIIMSVEG